MQIYERLREIDDRCGGNLMDALLELQSYRVLTLRFNHQQLEQALVRDREIEATQVEKPAPVPVRERRRVK
jgi:hypothetical protein